MRSVVSVKGKKKRRVNKSKGGSSEQRQKKSRMNDPLVNLDPSVTVENGADGDNGEEEGGEQEGGEVESRLYTEKEVLGRGTAGRTAWKMKHQKGKFNPKNAKKHSHRMAGTFVKSKKPK
jgi:hypothetical protein